MKGRIAELDARFRATFAEGDRVEFRPTHGRPTPRAHGRATILTYRAMEPMPYVKYLADGASTPHWCDVEAFLDDNPAPLGRGGVG